MGRIAKAGIVGAVPLAVAGVAAAKWSNTAQAGAAAPVPTSARPLPRLVDVGADKCTPCKAMAPILDQLRADRVNRWLGWKAGERAAVVVKAVAGVGVMLGGVYFVWTAV